MERSSGNVLGLRASGRLSEEDYRRVLVPSLESRIDPSGNIRILFLMDEGFAGWDMRSAWTNTLVDFRYRRKLEKVAVVGGPLWERWCAKFAGFALLRGEIRTFDRNQLAQAWDWLQA